MNWLKEKLKINEKISLLEVLNKNGANIPLLLKLEETEQDPEWHAEGNVFIHTQMVIDELYKIFDEFELTLNEKYILLMSVIFHDIAKPLVSKWKEVLGVQRLTAKGHEYEGMSYLFYKFLELDMDKEESDKILDLIGYHQMPKLMVVREGYNEWDFKLLTQKNSGKMFYLLELADMRGRTTTDYLAQLEYMEMFKLYCEDYNCFNSVSDIDNELKSLFKETFKEESESALSFLVGKTKKRIYDKEMLDPIVSYQKYFEQKDSHGTLFLMCGVSASGKSSTVELLKSRYNVSTTIELDKLREGHVIKKNNRREVDGRVRQEAKELMKRALSKKESVIFDACNLRKDFRTQICDLAEEYFAKTVLVFVETSVSQCIKNDKERSVRTVGSDVIVSQAKSFQYPEWFEVNEVLKL